VRFGLTPSRRHAQLTGSVTDCGAQDIARWRSRLPTVLPTAVPDSTFTPHHAPSVES